MTKQELIRDYEKRISDLQGRLDVSMKDNLKYNRGLSEANGYIKILQRIIEGLLKACGV
jgi:hypothetical protein